MRRLKRGRLAPVLLAWAASAALAQQSASFRLEEGVLNAGGGPDDGVRASSASYRMGLDALGDAVGSRPLSSPSFHLDSNFVPAYRPPAEVPGLFFPDADTLSWSPDPAASAYSVYRDLISALAALQYGACLTARVTVTTLDDAALPPDGGGYFYLVTSQNRLDEEGTKGFDSGGVERPNPSPCP